MGLDAPQLPRTRAFRGKGVEGIREEILAVTNLSCTSFGDFERFRTTVRQCHMEHHDSLGSSALRFIVVAFFVAWISADLVGQEATTVPGSVVALAKKYDEARKKSLGPVLDSFADELKLKVVPALTRSGKANVAIQIGEAASKLKGATIPVLPVVAGAPFTAETLAAIKETSEWKVFVDNFTKAEAVLNESYGKALDREKANFLGKGDPYGVVAIENELKRVAAMTGGTVAPALPVPPPSLTKSANQPISAEAMPGSELGNSTIVASAKITTERAKEVEALFVGKLWRYRFANGVADWFFRKNGEAVRQTTNSDGTTANHVFRWVIEDDLSVAVPDRTNPKWFWFNENGNNQFTQGTKDGTRGPLELVPDGRDPDR
jgi:hypothetical protein